MTAPNDEGGGFTFFAKNGRKVDLVNDHAGEEGDFYTSYSIGRYFSEIDFLGFSVEHYESSGYGMVNMQNGDIFWLDSEPEISPDKNHLIVSGFDEMNGLDLSVYKIFGGIIVKEKSFKDLSLEFHSWIDSQTARMREGSSSYEGDSISNENPNWKNYLLYQDLTANDWILIETAKKFPELKKDDSEKDIKEAYAKINKTFSDKKAALNAVTYFADAILFIPKIWYSDKDIIKVLVSRKAEHLSLASNELKNDKEIVKIAISNDANALRHASEKLRNDKEIVKIAISNDANALRHASERFRDDDEVAKIAITKNVRSFEYLSKRLRGDRVFIYSIFKECGGVKYEDSDSFDTIFRNWSEVISSDKVFLLKLLSFMNKNCTSYYIASSFFQFGVSKKLRDDDDFMLASIKIDQNTNFGTFSNLSERLNSDRSFILKVVAANPAMYSYVDNKFKNDEEIFLAYGDLNRATDSIYLKLRTDKQFFMKFLKSYRGSRKDLGFLFHNTTIFPRSFVYDAETANLVNQKKFKQ